MYACVGPLDHLKRRFLIDTGNWAAPGGKRWRRCVLDGLTVAYHHQVENALAEPTPLSRSADPGLASSIADAMHTIAPIAQKGGTGKTTLAVRVATDFEGTDGSVALVDLDPEASASYILKPSQRGRGFRVPPKRLSRREWCTGE